MVAPDHPIIVLLTDFGLTDTFVGQMKGVILSLAPRARIIDLTHAVTPQNVAQGAFLLKNSVRFFPEHSIFIAVVDPGVGTARRAIAVETEHHIFLAPDNGLLTPVLQKMAISQCVEVTEEIFMLSRRSSTFHGRDLFSPVAARLASGVELQELGPAIDPATCVKIPMAECTSRDGGASWEGNIICTDHFGNLVTSLDAEMLESSKEWMISAGKLSSLPVARTYGDVAEQQPLAYRGSSGTIEIAIRNGNAAAVFGLKDGDRVRAESVSPA